MRIKLKDAPRGYKHLEKFILDVIGETENGLTRLKVVKTFGFSIPYETDGRWYRDMQRGVPPFRITKNPTRYATNDECLVGMEFTLNLDLFTVLPGGKNNG